MNKTKSTSSISTIPTISEIDRLAQLFCEDEVKEARISSKALRALEAHSQDIATYNPQGECGGSKTEWEYLLEGYSMGGRASF